MLVGRAAEQERLEALLTAARDGRACALVLRGDPGIGKTALLEWTAERAVGFTILRATGVESEAELAYAGLEQLLRPLLSSLDALPAPQADALRAALALDAAGQAERLAVFLATLGLLAAGAEDGPLLCLMEDAHWVDAVSAEAMAFAARRIQAEAVAVVFAARTGTAFAAEGVPELAVPPLPDRAARELLGREPDPAPHFAVERLLALAAGNPLALLELPRSPGAWDDTAVGAPVFGAASGTLEAVFRSRVQALPEEGRRALLVAAAAGPSGLGTLLHDEALVAGLDHAETAGLARLDGAGITLRHPLVASAAYESATSGERRRAHAALAAAVPATAHDERAWHLAAASVGRDAQVADLLMDVAERAGHRGALAAQAHALIRASELTENRSTRCRRLIGAAEAALAAGMTGSVERLIAEAEAFADDALLAAEVAHVRWLAGGSAWADLYPDFIRHADAIADVDPERCSLMLTHAADYLFAAMRIDECRVLTQRAWRLIGERVAPGFIGVAALVAETLQNDGREEEAVALARAILDTAASWQHGDLSDAPWVAGVLVYAEVDDARERTEAVVALMRARGAMPGLGVALWVLSDLEIRQGNPYAGYVAAVEGFVVGELVGSWPAFWGATQLTIAEGALGRHGDARTHADLAARLAPPDNRFARGLASASLGYASLAIGDLIAAEAELREAMKAAPARLLEAGVLVRAHLAEVLLRLGRSGEAHEVLAAFENDHTTHPAALATACRCRVLAADDAALDHDADAALAAIDGRWPFEEARTRLVYGERLRRIGRRVDAREQLAAALAIFDREGADGWSARTTRELAATGATVRSRSDPATDALTAQERQVALLAAEGRTNREVGAALFISPKTVELHLSRVYRKLDIRSRAELARMHGSDPARLRGA